MLVHVQSGAARISVPRRFNLSKQSLFVKSYLPLLGDSAIHEIEVELSSVEVLDSTALKMLMSLKESAAVANKTISLLNISTLMSRVLEITDMSGVFNIKYSPC
jgi:anti-anti-sigma factor